jgi:hypothetical protein
MSILVNQAPVAFSLNTSVTGTGSANIMQVSSTGVTAGLTAGNFYLDAEPSNLLNGRNFVVTAGGWIKAHGGTQTVKMGLQIFPWNTSVAGARTASGTATFTTQASGTLVAGTYYDFLITQQFFGEANANTLICATPSVFVGSGTAVASTTAASPVTVAFASASQTEPITGINNTVDYPLASFVVTYENTVSDTVETLQLTTFNVQVV